MSLLAGTRAAVAALLLVAALSVSGASAQAPAPLTEWPPATVAGPMPTPVPGQLHHPERLRRFLAALPQAASRPLLVLQLGDSHTAGDMVSQGWRAALAGAFGTGGRGPLPPGRPYRGYLTWGVTASQGAGWSVNALFGPERHSNGAALGLGGFSLTASRAGATLALAADSTDTRFTRLTVCGVTGPLAGSLDVMIGGTPLAPIDFAAATPGAACFVREVAGPATNLVLTTRSAAPVTLTLWDTRGGAGGVTLGNLGVIGARASHLARADDAVIAAELAALHPDLVAIAFGTNEGFDPTLDAVAAEASIVDLVGRLRRLARADTPILLLGPPDAASNHPNVALPALPETRDCGGGWAIPGHLAVMRALEERLADRLGLAFWDWQAAMGGACSTMAWVAAGGQRADHVHFTRSGGAVIGAALASDLIAARARMDAASE